MTITEHAKQRMKERCGFNKKTAERMAKKAFYEGITHAQSKGKLNKWIRAFILRISRQITLGCMEKMRTYSVEKHL